MEDRQSANPGRVKFTLDDGTVMFGTIERADSPSVAGTPINKNTLFNSRNSERYAAELPSEAFERLTQEILVIVPAGGWSASVDDEGYYINRVDVQGMKESYSPIFSVALSSALTADVEEGEFEGVKRMVTYDGYVIFKAIDVPTSDLRIRLKGV